MKKSCFSLILLALATINTDAQIIRNYGVDPNDISINPAFAGSNIAPRIKVSYKSQWPSLFSVSNVAYISSDIGISKFKTGGGLYCKNYNFGARALTVSQVGGATSYSISLSDEVYLKGGLAIEFQYASDNYSDLLFPDQLSSGGPTLETQYTHSDIAVNSGLVLHGQDFYFGLSVNNLTPGINSILTRSLHVSGLYRIKLGSEYYTRDLIGFKELSFHTSYTKYSNFGQATIGAYFTKKPIVFGISYKGLPFSKDIYGSARNDVLGLNIGIRQEDISFFYGFDYQISGLVDSGNSHQIGINYRFSSDLFEAKRYSKNKLGRVIDY